MSLYQRTTIVILTSLTLVGALSGGLRAEPPGQVRAILAQLDDYAATARQQ